MDKKHLLEFIDALGVHSNYSGGDWIQTPCVLAPWQHSGGADNNPSAGFLIHPKGKSVFHCWACQERKNLHELVMKIRKCQKDQPANYQMNLKKAYSMAMAEDVEQDDLDLSDLGTYEYHKEFKKSDHHELIKFDMDWYKSFSPVLSSKEAREYLCSRKQQYPLELYHKYGVVYDTQQKRICFPTIGFDGNLYGLHGRSVVAGNPLRYFAYGWHGKRNPQVWMGEQFVDIDKPVVLTEGMFDMMSIARVYQNVLASRSSEIHREMYDRIAGASTIVTFYDNGTGGDVARKKIERKFTNAFVIHCIPSEEEDDAGDMSEESIRELLSEAEII